MISSRFRAAFAALRKNLFLPTYMSVRRTDWKFEFPTRADEVFSGPVRCSANTVKEKTTCLSCDRTSRKRTFPCGLSAGIRP